MADALSIQDEIHQRLDHYFASFSTEWNIGTILEYTNVTGVDCPGTDPR